jgi:hypothetical protein
VLAHPAHAAHDVLGETDPYLFVVVELRVMLEIQEGSRAGLRVANRVELEPVAPAGVAVAARAEQRPRLRDREVDIEENRLRL